MTELSKWPKTETDRFGQTERPGLFISRSTSTVQIFFFFSLSTFVSPFPLWFLLFCTITSPVYLPRCRASTLRLLLVFQVTFAPGSCLVPLKLLKNALCKKKIPRHIKLAIYAWSNQCRWNQKLIAQFGCTLRDERLNLISQRLDNYYQIQTKYYSVATVNLVI
jgi:hypothetical protein